MNESLEQALITKLHAALEDIAPECPRVLVNLTGPELAHITRRLAAGQQDAGATHYEGCYDAGPKHYECALNEIRRRAEQREPVAWMDKHGNIIKNDPRVDYINMRYRPLGFLGPNPKQATPQDALDAKRYRAGYERAISSLRSFDSALADHIDAAMHEGKQP